MSALDSTGSTTSIVAEPTLAPVVMQNIAKHYGGVQALKDVTLSLPAGQITGLVGDNGAGKSTIVKILSGVTQPSGGRILIHGQETTIPSPPEALAAGVETVYQDLALAPDLPVWSNFFLGHEVTKRGVLSHLGVLDKKEMISRTQDSLRKLSIKIQDVRVPCGSLSGGQRQAIAVGRAISWGTRVLLMDEPTAALATAQRDQVGALARQVADQGIPVLVISHDLPWVAELCDSISVLYRGAIAANLERGAASIEQIIGYITGSHGVPNA